MILRLAEGDYISDAGYTLELSLYSLAEWDQPAARYTALCSSSMLLKRPNKSYQKSISLRSFCTWPMCRTATGEVTVATVENENFNGIMQ